MWLLNYITKNNRSGGLGETGTVSSGDSQGMKVLSSNILQAVKQVAPYGIASIPPDGASVVVLPLKNGDVSLGTQSKPDGLSPGEVLLYSSGGATLKLANDGKVYVNGVEI